MATGGNLSRTLDGGHEPFYDFQCSLCEDAGKHVEAAKYCEECLVYLCDPCVTNHNRYPLNKRHQLLDQNQFAAVNKSALVSFPTKRCQKHPGELINIFCGNHDVVCCSVCKALEHRIELQRRNGAVKMENGSDEISGFLSVRGSYTGIFSNSQRRRGMRDTYDAGVRQMNRKLNEEIKILKAKLQKTTREFENEKTQLKRQHDRENQLMEIENVRMKTSLSDLKSETEKEEVKHAQEIKNLKKEIQRIEKENKELKEKMTTLEASQNQNEYESELRQIQGSEEEIKKLKEQVENLEKYIIEKDQSIAKKTQENSAMEQHIDKMTDQMACMRKGQDKLVDGQEELKRGQEEMMKMMKELQVILPLRKDNQEDQQNPKREKATTDSRAEHMRERRPDALPSITDKHWKL